MDYLQTLAPNFSVLPLESSPPTPASSSLFRTASKKRKEPRKFLLLQSYLRYLHTFPTFVTKEEVTKNVIRTTPHRMEASITIEPTKTAAMLPLKFRLRFLYPPHPIAIATTNEINTRTRPIFFVLVFRFSPSVVIV